MVEFVGIDPAGARRLITAMGDAAQRGRVLRPSLAASIAEAGINWPAGPGAEVLDNVGRFLDEAQRDLTWRTQTIERVEDTAPKSGLKTAEFAFGDATTSQQAGALAGKQTLAAWHDYLKDPSVQNWAMVQAALREGQGKTIDAAYSTGLLTTLGSATFGAIFAAVSSRNQNDPRGYSPGNLKKAGKDLKPLAEAFASADAAGTLPRGLRDHALGGLPVGDMAALLGLARQSREFVLAAGAKLLQYSGSRVSGKDWNIYWLAKALSQDVGATQRFLVSAENATLLLRPEVVNGLEGTDFEQLLATALDGALAPGAGDTTLRRDSWLNIIDLYSRRNFWPALSAPSPVGQILATHISQYFPELIAVWNQEDDVVDAAAGKEWKGVDSGRIASFFGGLLQSPGALVPLKNGYGKFLWSLDLGKEHPFGDASTEGARQEQRDRFYRKAVTSGALASMLFSGLHAADLSADETDKIITELLVLPLDILTAGVGGKFINGVVRDTSFGKALDITQKNPLKDFIEDFFDDTRAGDASDFFDALVDAQVSAFNVSRQFHGNPAIGDSDLGQLRAVFSGQLTPVLKSALKARGG
ncbi:hypothetical protein OG884_28730 [Streptosporangium sp. NBC_01755]|uniref:hypothetical protein n=1 Tax=unclassified Streptosporangium TaxID=2632669 RepID=UPI002DDC5B59|nr:MULTISPECIES: hypothetical protein [unclassified Streptosporangium]WSA23040.1 hypothetical protein OIE13_18855 [Streptosporangium sp. NBC_01810]WSC98816.1 hypothetical protein OG884_28730 [Streptosporangium sp. NBC_01755]